MSRIAAAAVAILMLPSLALAQDRQAETGRPPQRIRDITIQGAQPCPKSTDNEVVVCHRNDEPYRIPKALRDDGPIPAASQSWVNRASTVDQVGREAGGLPDTCSAVGTGGQSGCSLQINQQWAAEQRAKRSADAALPAASAAASGHGTVSDDGSSASGNNQ
ncbi:hypothetical protein [uncultured Sphingomonas sp.]|uniref:hypothetical protein n=1 Tax=uncultured Sphingomonas sp. TaxID=158754 RepID=UPI0035CB8001